MQKPPEHTTDEQREMCRRHNTKQCAAICLSHSSLLPLGECPSVAEVWTPAAIARWRAGARAPRLEWLTQIDGLLCGSGAQNDTSYSYTRHDRCGGARST